MSDSDFWVCEGLGASLDTLADYVDSEKIRRMMNEKGVRPLRSKDPLYGKYRRKNNRDRLDFLNQRLPNNLYEDIFKKQDIRDLLDFPRDGEFQYYLLYARRYPWQVTERDITGEEEARRYICDVLAPYMRENANRETLEKTLDYIYAEGYN